MIRAAMMWPGIEQRGAGLKQSMQGHRSENRQACGQQDQPGAKVKQVVSCEFFRRQCRNNEAASVRGRVNQVTLPGFGIFILPGRNGHLRGQMHFTPFIWTQSSIAITVELPLLHRIAVPFAQ